MRSTFSPFVVYGPSKSGTTWLQKILDSHPDVRCHFQLNMFPFISEKGKVSVRSKVVLSDHRSPFKRLFESEEEHRKYWVSLQYFKKLRPQIERLTGELKEELKHPEEQRYLDELLLETYRSVTTRFIRDEADVRVWGIKSTTDLDFLFRLYPEAKVVSIIRDGRDVATSKRYHMRRRGAYYLGDERSGWLWALNRFLPSRLLMRLLYKKMGWFGPNLYRPLQPENADLTPATIEKFASDWAMTTRYILDHKKQRPDQFHFLRYEDLKENPEETLTALFAFLSVPADSEIIQQVREATDFKRLRGNQKDGFFRKGISGDWKNHFGDREKKLFKTYAGDVLVDLGYEKDMDW